MSEGSQTLQRSSGCPRSRRALVNTSFARTVRTRWPARSRGRTSVNFLGKAPPRDDIPIVVPQLLDRFIQLAPHQLNRLSWVEQFLSFRIQHRSNYVPKDTSRFGRRSASSGSTLAANRVRLAGQRPWDGQTWLRARLNFTSRHKRQSAATGT